MLLQISHTMSGSVVQTQAAIYVSICKIKANEQYTSFGSTFFQLVWICISHNDNEYERKGNKTWTGLKLLKQTVNIEP